MPIKRVLALTFLDESYGSVAGGLSSKTIPSTSLSVSAHEADDECAAAADCENDRLHSVLITTNNRQLDLLLCNRSCRSS